MIPKLKKIIDLSHDVYHACPAWPSNELTNVNYEGIFAIDGVNVERLNMNVHTATHLDAPFHFLEDGTTIDNMDVSLFQGRGIVVDIRDINSHEIRPEHLERCADRVRKGDILLVYTGWAQKRGMNRTYLFDWPYFTKEAAEWIVEKGIKCVCTDGMSAGGWLEGTGRPPHLVLLSNQVVIVEEVNMQEELFEEEEWYITAFPVKLRGFGGAPTRVIAMSFE